jgi:ATP-dependent Clp protease ATP-binding subunit ClpX
MPQDLVKYGFIPEFVGRVAVIATLHDLEKNDLVQILTEPKNAVVRQFQELMAMDGIDLEFEEKALDIIADLAMKRKTGARGLRSIIEKLMTKVMFEAPSTEGLERIKVTKEDVEKGAIDLPEVKEPKKKKAKQSIEELLEEAS